MKEAIVDKETHVSIQDVDVPRPKANEILIKVEVAGTNPKDWKIPVWKDWAHNSGDDVAGTIEEVGSDVFGFTQGERVAAFHVMTSPNGAFAEYAIAPAVAVFPIPPNTSYEEAATIPLAAYTAAVALFDRLRFPSPWDSQSRKDIKRPLIIYGASTAVGAFAIKLAKAANIHPLVAVGSDSSDFVTPLLETDKGDQFVNYRNYKSESELVAAIKDSVQKTGVEGGRAYDVLDAVSEAQTTKALFKAVSGPPDASGRKPRITAVLPVDEEGVESEVEVVYTLVGDVQGDSEQQKLFSLVWGQAFARGLKEGWFQGHPYEVLPGGLKGLEGGLKRLREGSVRARKVVLRPSET